MIPKFTKKPESISLSSTLFLLFFLTFFIGYTQVGINTLTPTSILEVNGSMAKNVTTVVNSDLTLTDAHSIVVCNNGITARTITLPTAVGISGRIYTIKRDPASTATVTIATTSSQTIDGAASILLAKAGEVETLFSDGANWKTLSDYNSSSAGDWSLTGNAGTTPGTNYVGTTDAQDLVLKTNNTSRVNITSAGVTTIGDIIDGGNGINQTKIEGDGTLKFEGAAEVWDDLRVSMDKGDNGAVLGDMPGVSGGPQIYYFRFDEKVDAMSFVVQMPHSYKQGSTIHPHVHWTPKSTLSGEVEWVFEYSWQNYNATPLAFPVITTNYIVSESGLTAGTHLITSLTDLNAGIDGTGKNVSSILVCRIWRDSRRTNDTYNGDAGLLSFDIHFQIDTVGSRLQYIK